jgi:hypothetical protein
VDACWCCDRTQSREVVRVLHCWHTAVCQQLGSGCACGGPGCVRLQQRCVENVQVCSERYPSKCAAGGSCGHRTGRHIGWHLKTVFRAILALRSHGGFRSPSSVECAAGHLVWNRTWRGLFGKQGLRHRDFTKGRKRNQQASSDSHHEWGANSITEPKHCTQAGHA